MRHAVLMTVAVLVLCAAGAGCTKRVPWEGALEARKTMVLKFGDGTEIRGKINLDEEVELTHEGAVYRGIIEELTDQELQLRDCRFVRRQGGSEAEGQRLTHARMDLGTENIDSIVFERENIVATEHVQVDGLKTASRSVFLVVSGVVAGFLLSEKS
jgi:hypothetical protein